MFLSFKKFAFAACIFLFLLFAGNASAANVGDIATFNVDESFDASARTQVQAVLVKISDKIYFYIEKQWWSLQPLPRQQEILASLEILSNEFENKIYPVLTSVFGSEWKPGVDGDSRITVFFESMNSTEAGYFREADGYVKLQVPASNEREMVFLSLDKITDSRLKRFLAHEFAHLISFNQKNRIFGAQDDIWLLEARADYSSTILGYDDSYDGSNLQERAKAFLEKPSDSLTEWQGSKYDYGAASIFTNYLADHYGINILIDSLKSKYTGIESINYALQKNGFKESFSQIFTDWSIASVINDCSVKKEYCYLNKNLTGFKLAPSINFLPLTGNVSLSVTNVAKSWAGNWLKFIGGSGNLKLDFSSLKGLNFQAPYIVGDSAGGYAVKFLALDQNQKGQISIKNFGTDYKYLIMIPMLQLKNYNPEGAEPTYPYTYTVSVNGSQIGDQDIIQQLLEKIAYLKSEIERIKSGNKKTCSALNNNLYYGLANSNDVKCLQSFLNSPVTGYFGKLTKSAVIKFQKQSGLPQTGFVGPMTREKINQLLN